MKRLVPEHIENAALYPPGLPLEEIQRRYGLEKITKLNSNENCLGPSPLAVKAVKEAAARIHLYPDNSASYLREKLAAHYGVTSDHIILGNGSNELVQFIILTFLQPREEVITGKPSFLLYSIMSRVLGGVVREVPLKHFTFDLERTAAALTPDTKLVFISNPNNPTGTIVSDRMFADFMDRVPEEVVVVMDEAYAEYVLRADYPNTLDYIRRKRNLIVLRTFSKAYGLAGLRVGYALAPPYLVDYMERLREPFNINYLAQKAAFAALDDTGHVARTKENNQEGLAYLHTQLQHLGIDFVPSQTNFVLLHIGPGADTAYDMLMRQGVMVRSMVGYGLPEYLRVTVGLPEENKRFIEVLSSIVPALTDSRAAP